MDDRPSVTEADRGGVYEKDRQKNRQKNGNATEIDQIYKIFCYRYKNVFLHLIYFSGISMFFALFCLSVSEALPISVSVALGLSICFTGTSYTSW